MPKSKAERRTPIRHIIRPRWLIAVAGIVAVVLAGSAFMSVVYAGKIVPGVRLGSLDLGGMALAEAEALVREQLSILESGGAHLQYDGKNIDVEFAVADPEGIGLATQAVAYDIDATVERIRSYAADTSSFQATLARLRALLGGVRLHPVIISDDEALAQALRDALSSYEDPAVEPAYELSQGRVRLVPSTSGREFDYQTISRAVLDRVDALSSEPLAIDLNDTSPAVTDAEAAALVAEAQERVDAGTLTFIAGDERVSVDPIVYVGWLIAVRKNASATLQVSQEALTAYLRTLEPRVNVVAKNAKFTFKDGVVTQIQGGSTGTVLNVSQAAAAIARAIESGETSVQLPMEEVDPEATADTIANLGIKELVAVGKTNFAGSPTNRRHNIAVGANLLNGLLIKPGDELSLVKAIGPVDATLGYRQELVIKGNRTIPEFGGGLCQVATTLFRAVMNAGLPVVERQNHSYRVSYYEPPVGMDATIYEPKPDFRFRNDYGTYLLLQTRIEGDDLIFEFWGTKDSRVATMSTPRVYNIVAPPAPLTIESTDIPVGTTKCIERAHNGSDAEFTYSVAKDGKTVDTLFKSHYRPWRQICLVGVEKLSDTSDSSGSSNSSSNANASD